MELSWKVGDSSFAYGWLIWLLAGLVVVVLLVAALVRWRRLPSHPTYVAHAARLRALPRYRALVVRRTAVAAVATLFALVACLGGIILAGRLQQTRSMERDEQTRDIMLCLDVSGSMTKVDAAVIGEFEKIVDGLDGARIGLTVWNSTSITLFPLTDDYDFVREQLSRAARALKAEDLDYIYGTLSGRSGASLIGDGLASCVQRFDRIDQTRGRAIVLASDNDVYGHGVYTLEQAGDYAEQHHVVVHGIAAPATKPGDSAAFEEVVQRTGGTYHQLGDLGSADSVVASINDLEAAKIEKPPLVQVVDQPRTGKVVAGIGVGLLALVWAVEAGFALAARRGRRAPGRAS
ncbi:VWA domain-containing protein [Nocardioides panacisoli]|uniref:VWA domain-containing protein n=1 Tax=Nocardioides panacisoli TaxID=627624 RepID=A0ABP7HU36_9ACTN